MLKNRPLVTQFRSTFALIVLSSIVATAVTYTLAIILYMSIQYKVVNPANYYENQIPGIEAYIRQNNATLLLLSSQNSLEKLIPSTGISYQVIDGECNILYGTMKEKIMQDRGQLYSSINTTIKQEDQYIRTISIIEDDGKISGAVLLSYKINMTYVGNSSNGWVAPLMILILLSPFIYIIIFTLVFSKLLTNNINKPLQLLMVASRKIKEKDLDFEINYKSENELGRLCDAFKEMQEELKNSLSAQWKLEQERVEMVESLAHDLKTPLSIIQGYSEALIDSNIEGNEKLRRYLSIIKENSEKGSKLVHQMQYTSELERSGTPLHLAVVDIPSFIKTKVSHYALNAAKKNIKITTQIQGDVQSPITTDEVKLERILDNIVSNSLQYTEENGSICISVRLEPDQVFYQISDSGIGFRVKDMENVFKKFYRGDVARGSKDGHSGLGLYVAKQLVEQLGGSIKGYNNNTGGACIEFWHKVAP